MKFYFALLICFPCVSPLAQAQQPDRESCLAALSSIAPLSEEQKSVLAEATLGLHSVTIFSRAEREDGQVAVLLGEPHVKSPEDASRGAAVTRSFDLIGTETMNGPNYLAKFWFPRLMKKALKLFGNEVRELVGFKDKLPNSAMLEEHVADGTIETRRQLIAQSLMDIKSGESTLEAQTAFFRAIPKSKFGDDQIILREIVRRLDIEEMCSALAAAAEVSEHDVTSTVVPSDCPAKTRIRRYVDLESDRKLSFKNQINGLTWAVSTVAVTTKTLLIGLFGVALPSTILGSVLAQPSSHAAIIVGASASVVGIATVALAVYGRTVGLMKSIYDISGRDSVMADAIKRELGAHPGEKSMLAIVGLLHVEGMRKNLKNAGYSEVVHFEIGEGEVPGVKIRDVLPKR